MKRTKRTPPRKSSTGKAASAKKRSVKAKATQKTAVKKAPAKKKVVANRATNKTSVKKPAAKKAKTLTATDPVLQIVKPSKKGVDVPAILRKRRLGERTVRNIVFKANNEGKIKRVGIEVYVGA
jgi:hypothetical protein